MLELDGVEYVVKTPAENTQDLVDYVNQYCQSNNIQNSDGEVIFIEVNMANPLYLLFWAAGYLATIIQRLLYSIGRQFSIAAASEKQLINLALNAGLRRRAATHTTVRAVVYAASTGNCIITPDNKITILVSGKAYVFRPAFSLIVPANESKVLVMKADVTSPLYLGANALTKFDEDISNFGHMYSEAAVPGRNIESLASLRQRLLDRQNVSSSLDLVIQAVRGLEGVTACNIFYNSNLVNPVNVGTITIPPRHMALFLQGYNDNVARTIFSYVDRPFITTGDAIEQQYQLINGQVFSVYMIPPITRLVYIRVYANVDLADKTKLDIKHALMTAALDLDVGSPLSVASLFPRMDPTWQVVGIELSIDEGITYTYTVKPEANEIITMLNDNIDIQVGV